MRDSPLFVTLYRELSQHSPWYHPPPPPPPRPPQSRPKYKDCAVCTENYSPGYSHTCKSCMGGNRTRALAVITAIAMVALVAVTFLVANLVSVVDTGPPDEAKAQSRWQQRCSLWQARMRKTVPLTAVKIVVVVWQIVTQV